MSYAGLAKLVGTPPSPALGTSSQNEQKVSFVVVLFTRSIYLSDIDNKVASINALEPDTMELFGCVPKQMSDHATWCHLVKYRACIVPGLIY